MSFGTSQCPWESHAAVEEQVTGEFGGSGWVPKAARKFTVRGGCRILKPVEFFVFVYIGK